MISGMNVLVNNRKENCKKLKLNILEW
jgi:hypothetical protein